MKLIIPKATVLGVAEEITEELVDRINPRDPPHPTHGTTNRRKREMSMAS